MESIMFLEGVLAVLGVWRTHALIHIREYYRENVI
jgi:hypothetical protein